jgi:hypothetical protein
MSRISTRMPVNNGSAQILRQLMAIWASLACRCITRLQRGIAHLVFKKEDSLLIASPTSVFRRAAHRLTTDMVSHLTFERPCLIFVGGGHMTANMSTYDSKALDDAFDFTSSTWAMPYSHGQEVVCGQMNPMDGIGPDTVFCLCKYDNLMLIWHRSSAGCFWL